MNLLADESVERQVVERLRRDGHTVLYVAEMEPGITDEQVLERANSAAAVSLQPNLCGGGRALSDA